MSSYWSYTNLFCVPNASFKAAPYLTAYFGGGRINYYYYYYSNSADHATFTETEQLVL